MAGNITIIPPKENYQRVPKAIIFDQDIDALTLGIYVKVLCLGRKWKLNVPGIAQTLGVSVMRVKRCFASLEERGYLRRVRVKNEAGRFTGWDYEIGTDLLTESENRQVETSDIGENRPSEKPTVGKMNRYIIEIIKKIERKKKNL